LNNAQYSASVLSRPVSSTIMLRSVSGANPDWLMLLRSLSITMTRQSGRIASRHLWRMCTAAASFQSCKNIFEQVEIGLREVVEEIRNYRSKTASQSQLDGSGLRAPQYIR
jgi:hypothetical protein